MAEQSSRDIIPFMNPVRNSPSKPFGRASPVRSKNAMRSVRDSGASNGASAGVTSNGMKFSTLASLISVVVLFSTAIAFADHSININTADKAALVTLTGIGEVKAQAIIDYRTEHGPYASIEDIQNVSGIGPATYDSIKDHITVQGGNSTAPSPPPAGGPSPVPSPSPGQVSPPPPSSPQAAAPSLSGFVVDGGSDRIVIVGADVEFSAREYDSSKKVVENVGFLWNFGDGSTAQGASVVHRFAYPGRYAVVVTGIKDNLLASDRFTVTAEPAELSIRVLPDGGVEIENLAERDVDLSQWSINSAGQRFALPNNSLLLARQAMRISPDTLRFYASDSTELDFPNGTLAFRAEDDIPEAPTFPPTPSSVPPAVEGTRKTEGVQKISDDAEIDQAGEARGQELVATSSGVALAAAAASGSWMWWLGAFGLAAIAAGAVALARRFGRGEWNIVEE